MSPRSVSRMCTESATASVRMTIGADIEIGVSLTPNQPATPIPTMVDSMITPRVAKVALSERRINQVSAKITPNISGISVAPSLMPVSANALLSMDTPVRCTSMCG